MKICALGVWTHSHAGPTTSFLVSLKDATILLDTGIDPIGRLRANDIAPTACTHLYMSHMHADHSSGFANFVFTRELLGRATKHHSSPLTVLGSSPVIEACKAMLTLQYPERSFDLRWQELAEGDVVALGADVSIKTTRNTHSVDCHGCRLSTPTLDVGFTSDTAPRADHAAFFRNCDLLIGEAFGTEAVVGVEVNKRGHSTAEDLGRLVNDSGAKWVIPFHFGIECASSAGMKALLRACCGNATALNPIDTPTVDLRTLVR